MLLFATLLTSCVKRTFHSGFDSSRNGAFSSVEEFKKALYRASVSALKHFNEGQLEAFFDSESINALRRQSESEFWDSIQLNVPLQWGLERSTVSPVHLTRAGPAGIPRGGLVVFKGDVFPEGYYRSQASFLNLKGLMTEAPWFEWSRASKSFAAKKSGSPERILKSMFELRGESLSTFTLYRGSSVDDVIAPPLNRDPYKSGVSEYQQVMHFSSPSVNTALVWSRPVVWSSEIPRQELLDAVRNTEPVVYVGFEYNYPEIAFLNSVKVPVPLFRKEDRAKILCFNKNKVVDRSAISSLPQSVKECDTQWAETLTSGFPVPTIATKIATVRVDTLLKMVAIPDVELEEGYVVCRLKSGTQIEYTEAYSVEKNQIWLHANRIDADWGCPRGFANSHFYVDQKHIALEVGSQN